MRLVFGQYMQSKTIKDIEDIAREVPVEIILPNSRIISPRVRPGSRRRDVNLEIPKNCKIKVYDSELCSYLPGIPTHRRGCSGSLIYCKKAKNSRRLTYCFYLHEVDFE